MRLFIAIDIPKDISQELREFQREFKGLAKIKMVSTFHLTLKFLGDVEKDKVDEIKRRLKEISFDPFDLVLEDVGVFPDENNMKVIWVGALSKEVNDLQGNIDEKLSDLFPRDERFHSHLTLGRVKLVKKKEELKEKLKLKYSNIFKVDNFKLILSYPNKGTYKYKVLEIFS